MEKALSIHVPLHIYPAQVLFSFNEETKDVIRQLKKLYPLKVIAEMNLALLDYSEDMEAGLYIGFSNCICVIRMRKIPRKAGELATLQHEICHVAMYLLTDRMGMPHVKDSTEAFAYLTSYLTEQVYQNLPLFK